jgi:hypothetical protein
VLAGGWAEADSRVEAWFATEFGADCCWGAGEFICSGGVGWISSAGSLRSGRGTSIKPVMVGGCCCSSSLRLLAISR